MDTLETSLTEEQISRLSRSALRGLEYLHSSNICHRDIKCGNILLDARGEPRLGDFGVSETVCHTIKLDSIVGTPLWLAPEIITKHQHNTKADVWSYGTAFPPAHTFLPTFALVVFLAIVRIIRAASHTIFPFVRII